MKETLCLEEVAHLPSAADNCAVAKRRLEPNTKLEIGADAYRVDCTVLEGHRFAILPISKGQPLLSWGLPFGYALSEIKPGSYVSNQGTLEELRRRKIDFALPSEPNFRDHYAPYLLNQSTFQPGRQVSLYETPATFEGYFRGDSRGTGTRNSIVILAANSKTGSYARSLSRLMRESCRQLAGLDGIVAIAHTEAGGPDRPNNLTHLLRTLSGFAVHPNVGAILIVDEGSAWVDNQALEHFMTDHGYPLNDVLHAFLTLEGTFEQSLARGRKVIETWLDPVSRERRTTQPLERLKVALQCGGSDSFSGISSNPLLSLVAREILKNGGSANLAETNELVGAEPYVLSNVRDLKTANQFILKIDFFKHLMKCHGHTPEQNPSGGNLLRGLYNIALKSIGAAQKKHRDVSLDYVIDYAEPMVQPGYYFMNSPGNDLESIAGQVASGANLIFFSTGNGSVTNFPFVPTIKVMSTTERYQLMPDDMDVNAGAHLDGVPLEELAAEMFELTLSVAGSTRSRGEQAHHSQVSIWRNWEQTDSESLRENATISQPDGNPLKLRQPSTVPESELQEAISLRDHRVGGLGLLLPNSLCSSEVARMLADQLNQIKSELGVSEVVSLPHTEGCGAVRGPSQELLVRTLIGHMTHPLVASCMVLEHGCENVHHQYLRQELLRFGFSPQESGWVSIQLDGGVKQAATRVEEWFRRRPARDNSSSTKPLSIGIITSEPLPAEISATLADLTRILVRSGKSVVVPRMGSAGDFTEYFENIVAASDPTPSLGYAARIERSGLHVMESPSNHWVEMLTGLAATGVQLFLAYVSETSCQGHPFVPLIQFSTTQPGQQRASADIDLVLEGRQSTWLRQLHQIVVQTLSGQYVPHVLRSGNTDSQIPRGPSGVSV